MPCAETTLGTTASKSVAKALIANCQIKFFFVFIPFTFLLR